MIATFRTAAAFGAKYAADFPLAGLGGRQFAIITAAVTATGQLGATQLSGADTAHSAVLSKAATRIHLHDDLVAINRTAHTLALLGTPGLEGKFRLPRSAGGQTLLNTARAFAADAIPLKAQFVEAKLPADFLDTLAADTTAFEQAVLAKGAGTTTQAGATGGLEDTVHKAAVALHAVDGLVRNTYAHDPVKLAEWIAASHVQRAPKHAAPPPPPPAK